MTSTQLTTSLDYLTDAAHLLHAAAPETSAHLMRHRAALASHANVGQPEIEQQHVCAACGLIILPGHGASVKLNTCSSGGGKSAAARNKRPPKAPQRTKRTKVLTCGHCRRPTSIVLVAPDRAVGRRKGSKLSAAAATPKEAEAPKKTANASSKQRAKNRKAGLQALLSQQQRAAGSLTLADFMGK